MQGGLMHSLIFFMDARTSKSFQIRGKLVLLNEGKYVTEYWASSGTIGNQDEHNQDDRAKGLLPNTVDLKGQNYTLVTKPIPMPNKPGIMGGFYKINPHTIIINNVSRGDFGIHKDVKGSNTSMSAGTDGTLGCIGLLTDVGWKGFEADMKAIASSGISQIPLVVVYS